jgi:arginyl-tRNA synthetase
VKQLLALPSEVATAAERRAPHRMTEYALETARQFSAFYRDCQVVGGDSEAFRLDLCKQTKRVLARSLDLLGVEAPEQM